MRNQEVKSYIQSRMPSALILTITECKGMEFEEVLVYNFFKDSCFNRWWIFQEEHKVSKYHGFDEIRDFQLLSELKSKHNS